MKATHSNLLRGAASTTSRRAFVLASTARSASKTSFGLTTRRPLAVIDRAFNGARLYASSAEGNAPGVVSTETLFCVAKAMSSIINHLPA